MNSKVVILIIFLVPVVVLFGLGGCTMQGYNKAIGLDESVKSAWAQVENQLQRRFDLFDNLVGTVKGQTEQEKAIFLGIAEARKAYFQPGASLNSKVAAANQFEGALARLLVMQENYPQLRSSEAFLKLQDEVSGTENRLSVERKKFNDEVQVLNTFVRTFPNKFFASLAGVQEHPYFEPDAGAKERPHIDFSDKKPVAEKSE